MTTKLDLPDDVFEGVRLRAQEEGRRFDETVADLLRIGLSVTTSRPMTSMQASPSMLEERKRIADKFMTGEWGLELAGFEEGREADRESARERARAWSR